MTIYISLRLFIREFRGFSEFSEISEFKEFSKIDASIDNISLITFNNL